MTESRVFQLREKITVNAVGREVENFLRVKHDMVVEGMEGTGGYQIQAKGQDAGWKKFAGMDMATLIQIMSIGDNTISVNIGNAKWSDKVGAATVGALIFAPLMVTAGIGAYNQKKLADEVFECIEKFVLSGGYSLYKSVNFEKIDLNKIKCPMCDKLLSKGTKFCDGCGTKLVKECPNCKSEVSLDTQFCPNCGCDVNKKEEIHSDLICIKCGMHLQAGAKFCPECGTPAPKDEKNICVKCGAELPSNMKFCPECGTKIENV